LQGQSVGHARKPTMCSEQDADQNKRFITQCDTSLTEALSDLAFKEVQCPVVEERCSC
jgi:hypothetical protein